MPKFSPEEFKVIRPWLKFALAFIYKIRVMGMADVDMCYVTADKFVKKLEEDLANTR